MENQETEIVRYSPAKLTATLKVLDKRDDGYNNIEALTVFLPSISDKLEIKLNGSGRLSVDANDDIPVDGENLVSKAIDVFFANERVSSKHIIDSNKIDVLLKKIIPMAAGLGGGSANSAATLNALNHLCDNELTPTELTYLAQELGSDIPACLYSQALIMKGRGEIIELLDDFYIDELEALVVTPAIHCSTPDVYSHYDKIGRPKDDGIEAPESLSGYTHYLVNDLSLAVYDLYEELTEVRDALQSITGQKFILAGSGSSFFCLSDPERVQEMLVNLKESMEPTRFRLCANSPIV